MVGAPGSSAPAPPGGRRRRFLAFRPPSMFLSVDGGRSRIFSSGTSQGARRQRFLALMVDAPGSSAPAPPRGPVVDVS
jgi:hypothetical protein